MNHLVVCLLLLGVAGSSAGARDFSITKKDEVREFKINEKTATAEAMRTWKVYFASEPNAGTFESFENIYDLEHPHFMAFVGKDCEDKNYRVVAVAFNEKQAHAGDRTYACLVFSIGKGWKLLRAYPYAQREAKYLILRRYRRLECGE